MSESSEVWASLPERAVEMEALEYGDWAAQSSEAVLKAAGSSGLVLHCYHQTWGLHSAQTEEKSARVGLHAEQSHRNLDTEKYTNKKKYK